MLKILIVNTLYYPLKVGGAEISVRKLAEYLAKDPDNNVAVITVGEADEHFILENVEIWRLRIENTYWPFVDKNQSKSRKLFWHARDTYNKSYESKLLNIINTFRPDIINTNNLLGLSVAVWSVAKSLNIKVVHTLRDYYLQCPKTTKFKNNKSCFKLCFDCRILSVVKKKASQNVDSVVGISSAILQEHISQGYFIKAEKEVIYNGFEFGKDKIKKKVFQKNDFIVFGYIGQISTAKGVELLLDSLKELQEFQNWKLLIAGKITEKYKFDLKQRIDNKRLQFLGYFDSVDFYKKIDVLVVPSIWKEPFGRVVIEGMINKKVVLGSKIGGIPELLINNEYFQFEPTKKKLYDLLKIIVSNPRILNEFIFDYEFLEQFSIENYKERYLEVFKETLR